MGQFHKFPAAATDLDNPDIVRPVHEWDDDHISPAQCILSWYEPEVDIGNVWTNMPAAVTEVWGDDRTRVYVDMRFATESRLVVEMVAAGASGAEIRAQYSLDNGATWPGYLGPIQSIAASGLFASSWQPVPVPARIENCVLRLVGINGNGVADPRFRSLEIQCR